MKTEAKNSLSTSAFFMSVVANSPFLFVSDEVYLSGLSFLTNVTERIESLLVVFNISYQIQLDLNLGFHNPAFVCPLPMSFLSHSSTSRSLLSHAGFLLPLFVFLHWEAESSCTLRRTP